MPAGRACLQPIIPQVCRRGGSTQHPPTPTSVVGRGQVQLGRDVGERDAAVGEVNAAQTGADDVVVQPRDEVVGAVGAELGAVGLGNLGEAAGRDRAGRSGDGLGQVRGSRPPGGGGGAGRGGLGLAGEWGRRESGATGHTSDERSLPGG